MGRKNILAENMAGYDEMQTMQSSAIAGFIKGGFDGLFSSSAPKAGANTYAVPDIPKLGATRGGLGSTALVVSITINDNGNKGGVTGTNNATIGDLQKWGLVYKSG